MMEAKEEPAEARDALSEMLDIFVQNRAGTAKGIYSVCASHPLVLEAAMRQAVKDRTILLIESTANQVNQFGGYTGMKPADFPTFVFKIADEVGLERNKIILGGDHLGPVCWTEESADVAMAKSCDLVADYVRAGFQKIHLDASMACRGDVEPLSDETVANRAVLMCEAAEKAATDAGLNTRPVYVVGTEVPVPGGETEGLNDLEVTTVDRINHTVETHRQAFQAAELDDAWERVIGLVAQPGVEFNHTDIHAYNSRKARDLSKAVLGFPRIVYEAHSTDYQPKSAYSELVRDHFAILKVGPQLTFAMREALFALSEIEEQLIAAENCSNLMDVCEHVMLDEPGNWNKHYPASEPEGRFFRRFSFSDRIRYYWPHPVVHAAVDKLMTNLSGIQIPLPLLSQYLPHAIAAYKESSGSLAPHDLVIRHVMEVCSTYSEACKRNE